jgi:hypothetical protein
MQISINAKSQRLWIVVGLLTATLSLPLVAFQQGTYFLFDVRQDVSEISKTERILIAASVFQAKEATREPKVARQSEFETKITSLGGEAKTPALDDLEILKFETADSKTESSFGDSPPPPSGFFFTY